MAVTTDSSAQEDTTTQTRLVYFWVYVALIVGWVLCFSGYCVHRHMQHSSVLDDNRLAIWFVTPSATLTVTLIAILIYAYETYSHHFRSLMKSMKLLGEASSQIYAINTRMYEIKTLLEKNQALLRSTTIDNYPQAK